jgi:FkbM family methyltransferase
MKNNILAVTDKIIESLQERNWGRTLISKLHEILSRMVNREKILIENHLGYWFRRHEYLALPIRSHLRLRMSDIRSWHPKKNIAFFEMREKWWFRSYTAKEGDFIIDIGAGMGEDSYVFSKAVGPRGSVLAIEAHPSTFKVLSLFLQLNEIHNVKAENLAASNTGGTLWLSSLPDADWQCNSLICNEESENKIEVKTLRLDDMPILINRDIIDFMKINIEGAEVFALNGAHQTLAKTKNICVCCHDFLGSSTQTKSDVCSILTEAGFMLSFTSPESPPYERDFVYGTKRESEDE